MIEFTDLSAHGKLRYISHVIGKERGLQIILIIATIEILLLSVWYVRIAYMIQLAGFYIWFYKPELLKEKIRGVKNVG